MKTIYSICLLALLTSCASVFSGGRQTVTVSTPGVDNASCSLTDGKGRVWYIEETPGTALVKKGDGPISVICSKTGYEKGSGLLTESLAPSSYGNLLLLPGYFIDGMTGSIQKYESSIEIEMEEAEVKRSWEKSSDTDDSDDDL